MRTPLHRRLWSALVLGLVFLRELVLSSLSVLKAAFSRNLDVSPAIVAVPVDLRTDAGVTAVANMITLTPGTTSLHVSADRKLIYVHCLDAPAADEVIAGIRSSFEQRVREVEG